MRLNHVALNIHQKDELVNFYQNILGLHLAHQFELPEELSLKFFGMNQKLPAYMYTDDNVYIELFVHDQPVRPGVAHLCIEISNRENMIQKCTDHGYKVKRISRDNKPDLLFIEDKAGNCFELKEEKE
ncbi:MAG TPA: VOC family protein [Bacteroidales bacterium]|nr:VOC family protein [Bacteroidales bacterium]HPR57967.1 VOC family protein [Bacteroidales bacterium]HRW97420.1 VOC family protein [Bacteroidales bacterium]